MRPPPLRDRTRPRFVSPRRGRLSPRRPVCRRFHLGTDEETDRFRERRRRTRHLGAAREQVIRRLAEQISIADRVASIACGDVDDGAAC
jgi:hypothetical protein